MSITTQRTAEPLAIPRPTRSTLCISEGCGQKRTSPDYCTDCSREDRAEDLHRQERAIVWR